MIDNSGFLNKDGEAEQISHSFSQVEILGRGSANVYGRAVRYGKRWFFKGVSPDAPDAPVARQRLLKEFDIQMGVAHPSVARIISLEAIDGVGLCIVSEWIEGETLAEAINSDSLTGADRLRIFSEVVDAVGCLHAQGIVHRDLKPANIMIRKNGRSAVIIDFGLADTDAHLYQKSPAGTPGFASPRQHRAHTPFTGDDTHALGVILRQLCPGLKAIARHCLQGRYPTAEALRLAIMRRSRRRRLALWGSVAAVFLTVTSALLIYIAALKTRTETLNAEIGVMTDSLTAVSRQLDHEKAIRLDYEQRRAQIDDLKNRLGQRLGQVFADFKKAEDPADPDNLSLVRLIDLLGAAKNDFYATELPSALSDSELSEIEFSFVSEYNDILQQWNQTISRHRRSKSTE